MSTIKEMYSRYHGVVLGFHGCNEITFNNVISSKSRLKPSQNDYDWLGHGVYFWENSYERALEWAVSHYGENGKVIGAVISLGVCLDLTDYANVSVIKTAYSSLEEMFSNLKEELPKNRYGKNKLDCAVIEQIHSFSKNNDETPYDSVRGIFYEGEPMYKGSTFLEKTHTQLCIVNPNCIKGYFVPLETVDGYSIP